MALRRVVMMVVVMMMVTGCKSRWAGEHRQEQNYRENLFHERHPSRIELVTEAPCRTSHQENNEGGDRTGRRMPFQPFIRRSSFASGGLEV
ncbi:MAG: hypothetical protein WAL75_16525 [Terracidiphilus sp.]